MRKVDNGDFVKGAINEKVLRSDPEELMIENTPTTTQSNRPVAVANTDRINQSKLPENIKKAMIESPIPVIGLNDSLDMNFVEKTRRLMEQDGSVLPRRETTPTSKSTTKTTTMTSSELERRLTPIIENVIRKTLEEIVDKKLEQILMAQNSTTINENLAIKVGDTIFTGKITKSKSTK